MRLQELLKSAFATIRMNKRRSFLTMFGIVIGIAAVITILSLGNGYQQQMMDNMAKDEKGRISQSFHFSPESSEADWSKFKPYSEENIEAIGLISGVDEAVESAQEETNSTYSEIKFSSHQEMEPEFHNVGIAENVEENVIAGRALNKMDSDRYMRYAMIDNFLASLYFGDPEKAIHKTVDLDGETFTIVGVYDSKTMQMEEDASSMSTGTVSSDESKMAYIPKGTYERANPSEVISFELRVFFQSDANLKKASKEIQSYLNEHGAEKDNGEYDYHDMSEFMEEIGKQLQRGTYFISLIASISLFIAGVGVMNMMYISVSERTKEIGIRRALGATARSIQWQFLFEGIAITLIGGVIGYLLGIGLSFAIAKFLPFDSIFDLKTALFSVAVSVGIGIAFSIFPSRAAAQKNVVEILR